MIDTVVLEGHKASKTDIALGLLHQCACVAAKRTMCRQQQGCWCESYVKEKAFRLLSIQKDCCKQASFSGCLDFLQSAVLCGEELHCA
jgi:hypothetical protein